MLFFCHNLVENKLLPTEPDVADGFLSVDDLLQGFHAQLYVFVGE
jgi:hypothetical protein